MDNIRDYYDKDYRLLIESEEEDQVYCISNGEKIFRTDHQASVFLTKLTVPSGARVLDYGCGKAATLKALSRERTDVTLFLFDVSDMYVPFWQEFLPQEQFSTHDLREEWTESMDIVTSFFSLEHVVSPREVLRAIHLQLKPRGLIYCVVPDVAQNPADFVVIDHINHFTAPSLELLFAEAGFRVLSIDSESHDSAMIVIARKEEMGSNSYIRNSEAIVSLSLMVENLVNYWGGVAATIRNLEASLAEESRLSIYGAGFYGTYAATCWTSTDRIECFVDQDPFRQGKEQLGLPVVAPDQLPKNIDKVLVGLNPLVARRVIAQMDCWTDRKLDYFFL